MVICPGPTAIKPGGRNWFLDDRRANQPRKVLSFPQQEVRIEGWHRKADILLLGVLSRARYPAILGKMLLPLVLNLRFTAPFPSLPSCVAEAAFCEGSNGEHLLVGPLPGHSTLALCKEARTSPETRSARDLAVLPWMQGFKRVKALHKPHLLLLPQGQGLPWTETSQAPNLL